MPLEVSYSQTRCEFDLGSAVEKITKTPWGRNRTRAEILKSFEKSKVCYAKIDEKQVGFVRVISDFCFFAYIGDLLVDAQVRNMGIGTGLIRYAVQESELSKVKNWMVTTQDAKEFFVGVGFKGCDVEKNLVSNSSSILAKTSVRST